MSVINPMSSQTYLACGSNDGAVRIWRDVFHSSRTSSPNTREGTSSSVIGNSAQNISEPMPSLVTAFQAMKEVTPSTRGSIFLNSIVQLILNLFVVVNSHVYFNLERMQN